MEGGGEGVGLAKDESRAEFLGRFRKYLTWSLGKV